MLPLGATKSLLKHILQSLQLRDCINFLLADYCRGFLLDVVGQKIDNLVLKYEANISHFTVTMNPKLFNTNRSLHQLN